MHFVDRGQIRHGVKDFSCAPRRFPPPPQANSRPGVAASGDSINAATGAFGLFPDPTRRSFDQTLRQDYLEQNGIKLHHLGIEGHKLLGIHGPLAKCAPGQAILAETVQATA